MAQTQFQANSVRAQARAMLMSHYKVRRSQLGRRLEPVEFYPVHPDEIIRSILKWDITQEPFPADAALKGICDYATRTIRISDALSSRGELNYTLAHEIAHAVLHKTADGCREAAFRIGAERRVEVHNADPKALQREREAEVFAAELLMPQKAVETRFIELFNRSHLWAGSRAVADLYAAARFPIRGIPTVRDVASRLSSYSRDGKSTLCEFFGVSIEAMAIRLRELALIH